MGKRERRRRQRGSSEAPRTSDYADAEGNVLTLRDDLSAGTLRRLDQLESKPAASAEDRWQRRTEFLFERLAVRWEIAGLPLEGQKGLLARYRMASAAERQAVREAIGAHVRAKGLDIDG